MSILRLSPMTRSLRTLVIATVGGVGLTLLTAAHEGGGGEPEHATTVSSDEARIRAIIADQVAAWNVGDAKAFSANFAENGSFTNILGMVLYGHRAFEDRHAEIFRTFFKGSKVTMSPTKIRFIRPDVAIVDITTEESDLAGPLPGVKPAADGSIYSRLQEVFVKDGGDWRIESYHAVDVKVP